MKKQLLLGILFTSSLSLHCMNDKTFGKTFFSQRSQQSATDRYLVGWSPHINICDMDCVYGSVAITPGYSQSFNGHDIATTLFFNGTNQMLFGANNGTGVDVFGRNFFLNDQFDGTVQADAHVKNFFVDFTLYLGLDEWCPGLYFTIDAPLNWTRWNFQLEEDVAQTGAFIAQYALGNLIDAPSPVNSLITAYNGQVLNTTVFPDLRQTLRYGRVDGHQSKTRIADLELALGYNFWCTDCSQLGLSLRAIFPTGNRPDAVYLFEPVVGNGHHYELGFGINGFYELWRSGETSFNIFFDGRLYHMFTTQQRRLFDITANGIGSRNLMLKRFSSSTTYAGEMIFGPNVLARECKVSNDIHADASVMFDAEWCGYGINVGYNFWARTKDKISHIQEIPVNTYAVAGNSGGTGSDNANRTGSTGTTIKGNGTDLDPIDGNIFITTAGLNIDSAAFPTALSHSFFFHFGYTWWECEYSPFLGIGGKVEFSGRHNNALDQWTIWSKFGFDFN